MTVDDVHMCLDCDDNNVDEFETDHGIQVDALQINKAISGEKNGGVGGGPHT